MSVPVAALMEAAVRRRLVTAERAAELAVELAGCPDVPALAARLAVHHSPESILLRELLPTSLPGTGAYRALACLGQGRTASTWLGAAADGEWVAIKLYHPGRLKPGGDVELFLRDVAPLIGLTHRYLVGYVAGFPAADGRAVVVQRYVPGSDLASRGAIPGAMPEAQALILMRQVAKGLAELEGMGAMHGMLHPGNVLIDREQRARLTDYGLAFGRTLQAVRSGWDPRSLMLHAWSAPETFATPPRLLPASDVYALGCLAFWLMAANPPFPGTPDQQAQQHALAARPDVRVHAPGVSEITAKTLLKAMLVEPVARYARAADLIASIQRNLDRLGRPGTSGHVAPAGKTGARPPLDLG
jgi:serine/threonine protein kinase